MCCLAPLHAPVRSLTLRTKPCEEARNSVDERQQHAPYHHSPLPPGLVACDRPAAHTYANLCTVTCGFAPSTIARPVLGARRVTLCGRLRRRVISRSQRPAIRADTSHSAPFVRPMDQSEPPFVQSFNQTTQRSMDCRGAVTGENTGSMQCYYIKPTAHKPAQACVASYTASIGHTYTLRYVVDCTHSRTCSCPPAPVRLRGWR